VRTYRRIYREGGKYFFTVVTSDRWPCFEHVGRVRALGNALRRVRATHPFETVAIVVLPDHLHCIWKLPSGDLDFSLRWQLVKKKFANSLQTRRRIWQPRFWEHLIRNEDDMDRHMDYIHYNPVKHGLAATPAEWPHSSFRHQVRIGAYPLDWGASAPTGIGGLDFE
jgi:putative transposase